MPRPINTDLPGYDAEHCLDLTAIEIARLDAMAACRTDGREPQPAPLQQVRQWGRWALAGIALLAALALMGDNSEVRDPLPGESRAWMGDSFKAQVARGGQGR